MFTAALLQASAVALIVVASMASIDALPDLKFVSVDPMPPRPIGDPEVAEVKPTAAPQSPSRVPIRVWTENSLASRSPVALAAPLFDASAEMPAAGTPQAGGGWNGLPLLSGVRSGPQPPLPAPAPKPAAAEAPKAPVEVGGNVRPPRLIHQVQPAYPPLARQARIQGVVRLRAILSRDGMVRSLALDSGHPLLANAAIDAVRQWRYEPTLLNDHPVEVILMVDVNFVLAR